MIVEIDRPGGRQILEGAASVDERVDLSDPAGQPMAGPMGGAPVAQAVVVEFRDSRADEVVERGTIRAVAAEDDEFCEVRLATDAGTRTVDRAIECRTGDGGSTAGTGNPLTEPLTCELADGSEWSLHGRIVLCTAVPVDSVA